MAYKDKDKQREAQRDWVRQKRKGSTDKGSTSQGSTDGTQGLTDKGMTVTNERSNEPSNVIPSNTAGPLVVDDIGDTLVIPTCDTPDVIPKQDKEIKCITIDDQAKSVKTMAMARLDLSKYKEGMTVMDERSMVAIDTKPKQDFPKTVKFPTHKRGKDIKVFADLPPHVQETINILSDDKTEHKRRTAIAIHYQHLFIDRYHSTGVV